ncbi:MAG TPA: STAS domain-containing protein [Gaiellales bacterium]|nr:STAS domain-containing protein [Gaiellales bacterium]
MTLEQLTADIWVVSLLGEHDLSMVDKLRDRLDEAFTHEPRLIIDLTEATFVDSTVLGVLFAVVKQAAGAAAGETLALAVVPGSTVDRTIALTGLTPPIVATYPSRDEVLAAWRRDDAARIDPRAADG